MHFLCSKCLNCVPHSPIIMVVSFGVQIRQLYEHRAWIYRYQSPLDPIPLLCRLFHCSSSYLNLRDCVSVVWPMRNRDVMSFTSLNFLKPSFHSLRVGFIQKSLFFYSWLFVLRNLLTRGFESVYANLILSKAIFKANLAVKSAFSFPFSQMWLGTQHTRISFELDNRLRR